MPARFLNALVVGAMLTIATTTAYAQVEEVVVTAQKREQSIQDVPISINAITAQDLTANVITDVFDLRALVPALEVRTVDPPSQGASFALRGLGTSVFNMGFEAAVGTFIDGVYRSRSGLATNFELFDLERVEVLKGPQGTLFGKNTSAGVVHFISKAPVLGEHEGMAQVSYEEHNRARVSGMVNLPLNDNIAARLSGSFATGDGWLEDINSGDEQRDLDRWQIKGQLLWEPQENLSIHLIADFSGLDEKCCNPMNLINDPLVASVNGPAAAGIGARVLDPPDLDALQIALNTEPGWDAEDFGIQGEINWQVGNVTVTSITAYRDYEDVNDNKDNDFGGVDILRARQDIPEVSLISEEFRISGVTESLPFGQSLDWVVGFYYAHEEISVTNEFVWGSQVGLFPFFNLPPPFGGPAPGLFGAVPGRAFFHLFEQEIDSVAGFGHFTLSLTDRLSITGGFRWSNDEKDGTLTSDQTTLNAFGAPNTFPLPVVFDYTAETSNSEPTGTASIQYDWTDDVMTFFTYSRGYKSGGISMTRDAAGPSLALGNPPPGPPCPPGGAPVPMSPFCTFAAVGDPTFEPEFADHYEFGVKSTLFNSRLRLNASAWLTEFEGLQVQTLRPDGSFAVSNVAGASSQGVEADAIFVVNDAVTLTGSIQWLDATFDDNIPALIPGLLPLSNQNLPYSSEWTGNVGLSFEQPFMQTGWNIFFNSNVFFRSQYFSSDPSVDRKQDSHQLTTLKGGLRSADNKWEVSIFCRNCTDERYKFSEFVIPFDGLILGHGSRWSHIGNPRFIGGTATYRF